MERGTNCAGVVPLVWGTGNTCVGEEMEITCGTWILLGVQFVLWSPSWCTVRCGSRLLLSCEIDTMVVAPSGKVVKASCCCCTSLVLVFNVWFWN